MRTLLITAAFVSSMAAQAEVYRWVGDGGTVHFSDEPRPGGASERIEIRDVNTAESVDVEPSAGPATGDRVILYSASWCGHCDRARAYFERNDIAFAEYDVETTRRGRRFLDGLESNSVPVIVVGDRRLIGFGVERFERLHAQ